MANSCETCKHYEVEPYHEPCISCRFRDYDVPTKWENPFKQKTNADRIRAMSDEELAESLSKTVVDAMLYSHNIKKPVDKMPKEVWEGLVKEYLEWLKQPAEERQ